MKVLSRDFSTKEKLLILVLALVLVALAYYQFVHRAVVDALASAQAEADSLTVELPDGINDATGQTPHIVRIFSIGGKPRKELQKGVNIVLMSDGTINKVLIK